MFIRRRVDRGRTRYEAVEAFRTPEGPRQRVLATWTGNWRVDGVAVPEEPQATLTVARMKLIERLKELWTEEAEAEGNPRWHLDYEIEHVKRRLEAMKLVDQYLTERSGNSEA